MKIDQNAPAYPNSYKLDERCPHNIMGGCEECLGMTIRLKLAESAMASLINLSESYRDGAPSPNRADIVAEACRYADDLIKCCDATIECANRDEPNG